MPPSLLCHFLSVPKGGIVSKFDCIAITSYSFLFCFVLFFVFSLDKITFNVFILALQRLILKEISVFSNPQRMKGENAGEKELAEVPCYFPRENKL